MSTTFFTTDSGKDIGLAEIHELIYTVTDLTAGMSILCEGLIKECSTMEEVGRGRLIMLGLQDINNRMQDLIPFTREHRLGYSQK